MKKAREDVSIYNWGPLTLEGWGRGSMPKISA